MSATWSQRAATAGANTSGNVDAGSVPSISLLSPSAPPAYERPTMGFAPSHDSAAWRMLANHAARVSLGSRSSIMNPRVGDVSTHDVRLLPARPSKASGAPARI